MLKDHVLKELISKEDIEKRIIDIAKEIDNHHRGEEIVLLVTLKGAFVFATHLIQKMSIKANVVFMQVGSYLGFETTKDVQLKMEISEPLEGKTVILVEDTVETGYTLSFLTDYIKKQYKPKDLKICSLIDKPKKRKVKNMIVDYACFILEQKKIVGFGLDYNNYYRNLDYLGELVKIKEENSIRMNDPLTIEV